MSDSARGKPLATPAAGGRSRRLVALVVKESLQVVRDPSSILVAFLLPLLLIFLFGYGLSLDNDEIDIALVVEDETPAASSLAQGFLNTRYFTVRTVARDRRAVQDDLVAGRVRGVIVIPAEFARDLRSPRLQATIQVLADGSDPNTASFVQNYARGVVASWLEAERAETVASAAPPIAVEARFWFNAELASRNMLVPASIAVIMTLIGTLLTALVVAREWERGTMEALMATPVGIGELLAGKLVPYFLLGMGAMAVCVALALFLFDVTFRGSAATLFLVSAVFLFPALGQGLLISSAAKNQFVASQLALMTGFLPSFVLSGLVFEISSMPQPIQWITYAVQARYFVTSLQTIFLAGDIWPLLLPNLGAMVALAVIFFLLAARSTRKTLD